LVALRFFSDENSKKNSHRCSIVVASLLHRCCLAAASLLHRCCITAASLLVRRCYLRHLSLYLLHAKAGRGPVLGSLIYVAAFWPVSEDAEIKRTCDFDDSKKLKEG
jgi:hypothetical protein